MLSPHVICSNHGNGQDKLNQAYSNPYPYGLLIFSHNKKHKLDSISQHVGSDRILLELITFRITICALIIVLNFYDLWSWKQHETSYINYTYWAKNTGSAMKIILSTVLYYEISIFVHANINKPQDWWKRPRWFSFICRLNKKHRLPLINGNKLVYLQHARDGVIVG